MTTEEKQETYQDLVSVDVGIEADIGLFGNLSYNAQVKEQEPITEKSWETSYENNGADVVKQSPK